jgi:hypothetical protein
MESRTNSRKNGTVQCLAFDVDGFDADGFDVDGEATARMWKNSPTPQPTIDHRGQKKRSGVTSDHTTTWTRLATT